MMDPNTLADSLWDRLGIGSDPRSDEWYYFLWEWNDFMTIDENTPLQTIGELWDEYIDSTEPPHKDSFF
jgi:hypothetical protein